MGLLKQNNRQYYASKKTFTSDGTAKYRMSTNPDDFHKHHDFLGQAPLANPNVKLYIDGEYYAQEVVDDTLATGTPPPLPTILRWYFLYDPASDWRWHIEFNASYLPASGVTIDVEVNNSLLLSPGTLVTEEIKSYQVTSLEDIISNFMTAYVGEDKIIGRVNRTDVQFHAMRGLQEMSFDTFKSCKSQEIEVPASLVMLLPQDYVNYVKVSRVDSTGIKRVLYQAKETSNPRAIRQKSNGDYEFNADPNATAGDVYDDEGNLIYEKNSDTWDSYKSATVATDQNYNYDNDTYWPLDGNRYGLNPSHAQVNGSYFIDCNSNQIHFSSNISGETVILDYISDSLGTDREMVVHKFAEEAMYKWITYAILSTRANIPEYIVQRYKKERFAETRKAKLRLSNIKLEELTQVLRGKSKLIKH
jgi:hypothetical protein